MKTNKEIVCIAHLEAKEGKKEMLLQILQGLIKPSRNEPGCLSYHLHASPENPNMFTFIDKFKNQEAFDYHCETHHVKEAFDNLIPPLVESMTITLHQEIAFAE
ncbi:putative monooxygenase YcnE [Legionella nautarum]|uniref:Putative monooxygenase YcnE n=1 Tax=Legionella nautarum TaxID=45070 RepID=A0A0W0WMJ3_9GAMM|nr:putative quinol monooxygenase [Legionella nautarum]KTD33573.1 putative monooxygenase YcnE [Legionella nautarum]